MSRTTVTFKVYRADTLVETQRFDAEVIKLGTLPSCQVRLDDDAMARQHAVIEVVGEKEVKLIDLGSPAGTCLNGQKIEKFATLKDGDVMSIGNHRIEVQIANPAAVAVTPAPQLDARQFEVQDGSRVAEVTAMYGNTVIDVQHLGQTQDRRKQAPAWMTLGGTLAIAGAALFGYEASRDWNGYSEQAIAAREASMPAPAKPGNGLGGLGFGLAMLGLVPIGIGFTRLQDRSRKTYTLGESHDAAMHVPAATLPGGESFPLVRGEGEYSLQFTAEMEGELTAEGQSASLAALIASGRAQARGGIYSVPLAPGAKARVRHGALTFHIHSVAPGVVTARKGEIDKPFWVTNGGAFAVLGSMLLLTHLMPNQAGAIDAVENDDLSKFVGYLAQPTEKQEQESIKDEVSEEPGGVSGERHRGDEGAAGNPSSKKAEGRYAMKGPSTAIPSMARDFDPERRAREAGILGLMASDQGHFMASVDGKWAVGNNDEDAWGKLTGAQVGESFGGAGLGLVGTGRGGGGTGAGTLGLDSVGLIGHNRPGDGNGLVRRTVGFGDRTKKVPDARAGKAEIVGSLDKDIIRRVVRAHINEVRYCYNQGLAKDANLKGRVAVQFQIGATGKVPTAVVSETDVKDGSVNNCIAQAVRRWQFPKPPGGGTVIVTYPFVLSAT
jgi:TonB family protein